MMDEIQLYRKDNQQLSATEVLLAVAEGKEIRLTGCTISGQFDLNRLFMAEEKFNLNALNVREDGSGRILTFERSIHFNGCRFEGEVFFACPWDKAGALRVIFKKEALFNSSIFGGASRFDEAIFEQDAGFDGCVFERVSSFRQTAFTGRALFRTAMFNGYGLFNQCWFGQDVQFVNTCFARGCNFTGVRFEKLSDFGGVHSQSKSIPIYEGVFFARRYFGDDESFWRFVKQTCQEAGDYQQAGENFYRERCANFWKRLRGSNFNQLKPHQRWARCAAGIRLLPELIFGRWLFGYGERPVRILLVSFLIILCCGFFYASGHCTLMEQSAGHSDVSLIDGLYFSTVTFTTVGYGDIYPFPDDKLARLVAMFEATTGVLLMPMFVISLAKRFSRG
jgi:hypothetical protein